MSIVHPELCFCTAITLSHYGYAAALSDSIISLHPEATIVVLLVDQQSVATVSNRSFHLICLQDLGLSNEVIDYITFSYSAFELCCAVRASLLRFLIECKGFKKVIFLDSDVYLYRRLDVIIDKLDNAPFVLTPHVSKAYPADLNAYHEIRMLLSCGLFNAGFLGVRAGSESVAIVRLLEDLQLKFCFNDYDTDFSTSLDDSGRPIGWPLTRSMFVDQLFLNLIPLYSKNSLILEDIQYNLGHWNLWQASSFEVTPVPAVDGKPVNFIHFSGCSMSENGVQMRWGQSLYSGSDELKSMAFKFCDLAAQYLRLVSRLGLDYSSNEYGYARFANSELVSPLDRRTFADLVSRGEWHYGPPSLAYDSCFRWQSYRLSRWLRVLGLIARLVASFKSMLISVFRL